MSALPDLRLQATPEVKSKAKPPAKEPEPRKNEASSFADVYARERQSKPDERAGGPDKADREQSSEPAAQPSEAAGNAAEQPEVATAGNFLPSEAAPEALDPLLAMALGGIQNVSEEASAVGTQLPPAALVITGLPRGHEKAATDLQTEQAPVESSPGIGELYELATSSTVAQPEPVDVEEAVLPIRVEPLFAQAVKTQSDLQGKPDTKINNSNGAAPSPSVTTELTADRVDILKSTVSNTSGKEQVAQLAPEVFALEPLESLKDGAQPVRTEPLVAKPEMMIQALNQSLGVTPRLPLVPGQPVAMHQGGWSEAVVDRVMWLSSQNLKSAEIQLDPAELGRMEVRVNLSQDQAQVTFASPNAGVRDALEGQMHRLRELFAQQGMNLADANVSDQSLGRGWQGQGEGGRSRGNAGDGLLAAEDGLPVGVQEIRNERLSAGRGLVDYYA